MLPTGIKIKEEIQDTNKTPNIYLLVSSNESKINTSRINLVATNTKKSIVNLFKFPLFNIRLFIVAAKLQQYNDILASQVLCNILFVI